MIPSLSSLPTSPFRYVYPGQGEFVDNPSLALESYLESFGFPLAEEFIKQLLLYQGGSYIALLDLLSMLGRPGISQACAILKLELGLSYESVREFLNLVLPEYASVDYSSTLSAVALEGYLPVLQDYLGYPTFNPEGFLDPEYLLEWIKKADPSLQQEVSYLKSEDFLSFLATSITRLCSTDVTLSVSAYFKLSSLLAKTFSPAVMGSSIDQELYFSYVAAIKATS